MINRLKTILHAAGVNRAVLYFLLGKGFSFIATPLTLYFVASRLSPAEQGYYYTFGSLLGLSIFFELGLGVVITQFASHEFAALSWDNGRLSGPHEALSRIISLVRKSVKWYAVISGLLIAVVLPAGWYFLSTKAAESNVSFVLPWVLLIVFFGVTTCFIPITSTLEGCGLVAEVQQLRLLQAVSGIAFVWFIFLSGGKLLASPAEFIMYWGVIVAWLLIRHGRLLHQIFTYKVDDSFQISWFREIFPMQWKIAVSWIAAYFSNYLFVPLLFSFRGPVEAGKMGMSLRISAIVYTLSMAWINARIPYYGALIKKEEYDKLDRLSWRSSVQALAVGLLFSVAAVAGLGLIQEYIPKYSGRVLSAGIMAVLCLASLVNVVTSAIGGYLRAHKTEPLMIVSVFMAFILAGAAFIAAKYFNASVMAFLYTGLTVVVGFPLYWSVLTKKRREWHGR